MLIVLRLNKTLIYSMSAHAYIQQNNDLILRHLTTKLSCTRDIRKQQFFLQEYFFLYKIE